MKITVQITVQSNEGQVEVVQEVAQLERGPLQPRRSGCPSPKPEPFWPGWNARWPSGKLPSLSTKHGPAPAVAGNARAKIVSRSSIVRPSAN